MCAVLRVEAGRERSAGQRRRHDTALTRAAVTGSHSTRKRGHCSHSAVTAHTAPCASHCCSHWPHWPDCHAPSHRRRHRERSVSEHSAAAQRCRESSTVAARTGAQRACMFGESHPAGAASGPQPCAATTVPQPHRALMCPALLSARQENGCGLWILDQGFRAQRLNSASHCSQHLIALCCRYHCCSVLPCSLSSGDLHPAVARRRRTELVCWLHHCERESGSQSVLLVTITPSAQEGKAVCAGCRLLILASCCLPLCRTQVL